ncbi:MAG: hypothetical protein AAFX06_02310 [Planctomycetota bacterium]
MNVVILHCHYERGGVTQVVENHVAALGDIAERIVLVSGPRASGLSDATLRSVEQVQVDGLEYDAVVESAADAAALATTLREELNQRGLDSEQTVLHWHNHSLGKNVAQPDVVRRLAEFGFRQLLQIHDFAEDYRPSNLLALLRASRAKQAGSFADYCYPVGPKIRYATLTRADARVLESLGVTSSAIDVLPNSVTISDAIPDADEARDKLLSAAGLPSDFRWCLYPVRGIRRKNLGEFCLLSRLFPDGLYAGVTLPPATKIERTSYERWQTIAKELAPQAVFDAGTFNTVSFRDNLAASEFILSTSVAEGFGMAFLEPWLAHRGVIARRLPAVVSDFEQAGLQLDGFYRQLVVPADTAWHAQIETEVAVAFSDAWRDVPEWLRPEPNPVSIAIDRVDFGKLTTRRQIEILHRVHHDAGYRTAICELNSELLESLEVTPESVIEHNRQLIADAFSTETATKRLMGVYSALLNASGHKRGTERLDRRDSSAASSVQLVCRERDFFPCRTESVIER